MPLWFHPRVFPVIVKKLQPKALMPPADPSTVTPLTSELFAKKREIPVPPLKFGEQTGSSLLPRRHDFLLK
jgi:hypothetical protein